MLRLLLVSCDKIDDAEPDLFSATFGEIMNTDVGNEHHSNVRRVNVFLRRVCCLGLKLI